MKPDTQERPDFEKAAELTLEQIKQEVNQAFYFEGHMIHQNIDVVSRWVYERLKTERDLSRKRIEELEKQLHELLNDFDELSKKASNRIEELENKEKEFDEVCKKAYERIEELEAALKVVRWNFPEEILKDQMNEDYEIFNKVA